jgi:hypothetical protein
MLGGQTRVWLDGSTVKQHGLIYTPQGLSVPGLDVLRYPVSSITWAHIHLVGSMPYSDRMVDFFVPRGNHMLLPELASAATSCEVVRNRDTQLATFGMVYERGSLQ